MTLDIQYILAAAVVIVAGVILYRTNRMLQLHTAADRCPVCTGRVMNGSNVLVDKLPEPDKTHDVSYRAVAMLSAGDEKVGLRIHKNPFVSHKPVVRITRCQHCGCALIWSKDDVQDAVTFYKIDESQS